MWDLGLALSDNVGHSGGMSQQTERLTIRLSEDLRSRLDAAAEHENRKVGDLVRLIIKGWLDQHDAQ